MAGEAEFGLDRSDVEILRALVGTFRRNRLPPTTARASDVDDYDPPAPEVYLAKTPAGGIPLSAPVDSPGTGSSPTEGFSSASCKVYNPTGEFGVPLWNGLVKDVFNQGTVDVPGDTWILVAREKWGKWFVVGAAGAADTGGDTADGCDLCECFPGAGNVNYVVRPSPTGACSGIDTTQTGCLYATDGDESTLPTVWTGPDNPADPCGATFNTDVLVGQLTLSYPEGGPPVLTLTDGVTTYKFDYIECCNGRAWFRGRGPKVCGGTVSESKCCDEFYVGLACGCGVCQAACPGTACFQITITNWLVVYTPGPGEGDPSTCGPITVTGVMSWAPSDSAWATNGAGGYDSDPASPFNRPGFPGYACVNVSFNCLSVDATKFVSLSTASQSVGDGNSWPVVGGSVHIGPFSRTIPLGGAGTTTESWDSFVIVPIPCPPPYVPPMMSAAPSPTPPRVTLAVARRPCRYEGPVVGPCTSCGGNTPMAETRHLRVCTHPENPTGKCSRTYTAPESDRWACDGCNYYA